MKSIVLVGTQFNVIYENPTDKIDNIKFSDKRSLLDYDIAVIGLNSGIIEEYFAWGIDESYKGYPLINESQTRCFIDDLKRRKEEINSLLSNGRNVYFILGDECICFYHTYKQSVSGSGKNAKTTKYVEEIDLAKFLLGEDDMQIIHSEGLNFNILPNTQLTEFSNKIKNLIYFKSYFKCKFIKPAITTSNKENIIAGLIKFGNAFKIILPELVNEDSYDKKHEKQYLNDVDLVLNEIRELDNSFSTSCECPAWLKNHVLSNESHFFAEIEKIDEQIDALNKQKSLYQSRINENFKYKKLLCAYGTELEEVVKSIFEELGFELLKSRRNRSDINLKYGDHYFVCEIKGLTKSAGEKNANQLQKWETEFFEDFDVHPKQILIVNAFRELPLTQRTEDVFPQQMLDYAIKKEQCLISTTQLLCFYLAWVNNKDLLLSFIEKINSTNGIFFDYNDWQDYIEVKD
ncbi:MAG: hypothetical protein HDP28_03495 [Clostridia bacterium]|nr:hypothetical protein [Clostridia bacterium]